MIKHSEKIQKFVREEFNEIKLRNGSSSVTFHDSTSTRNRRYININAYFRGGVRFLEIIHIQRNINAATAIKLVEEPLKCFDLDLNKDMVAIITDGTRFMVKFEKQTCPHHVTCCAYAIHLAVCDVLYETSKYTQSEAVTIENNLARVLNPLVSMKKIVSKHLKSLFSGRLTCKTW